MKSYGVTIQIRPTWQSLRIALFGFQYFVDVKLRFLESDIVLYRTVYYVTPMGNFKGPRFSTVF